MTKAQTVKFWLYLRRFAVASLVFATGIKGVGQIIDTFGGAFGPLVALGGMVLSFCVAASIVEHGL